MNQKNYNQLINNLTGQLKGIDKMIEEDRDCLEVVTQLKAAKSACSSIMDKYISENTKHCLTDMNESDKRLLSKLIKELCN